MPADPGRDRRLLVDTFANFCRRLCDNARYPYTRRRLGLRNASFCPPDGEYQGAMTTQMDAQLLQLQTCMYQYSRAIYRSIKDLIDPYSDSETQLESRRAVLEQCEQTMERLAADPHYFAKPDRALFQDIRR